MEMLLHLLVVSWWVLAEMAPYLLLGFLVAGILAVLLPAAWVERHLGGDGGSQIVKASLFGVPLPLCSCGVLPVAVSLHRHGAGRGATTAFLLSTPQTGVDSIAVTYALLGPFLAVFRPIAAFVTGLFGGVLVHTLDRHGPSSAAPEDGRGDAACCSTQQPNAAGSCCSDDDESDCCSSEETRPEGPVLHALRHGFITLPKDIGRPLLVGIGISGLIAAFLPPHVLGDVLGGGLWPMLAAMVLGVPLYVCATASTPIALALIHAGLSPGAALVFLVTGPATNAAAVTTLLKVLGRRATILYLVTVVVCALGAGLAVDGMITSGMVPLEAIVTSLPGAEAGSHAGHLAAGEPLSWFSQACAVLLLGVLAVALWPRRRRTQPTADGDAPDTDEAKEDRLRLTIDGMSCQGCVGNVTRALEACPGVRSARVDLQTGTAEISGRTLAPEELCAVVRDLGFEARAG
jgi:uncharacterized membrane protein YraQ (UPF0718 family)/copper chaperone CopZ